MHSADVYEHTRSRSCFSFGVHTSKAKNGRVNYKKDSGLRLFSSSGKALTFLSI